MNKRGKSVLFFIFVIFLFIFSINFVFAACWQYTTQSNCESILDSDSCKWRSDSWGSWCEELNCWSLDSQSECTTTNIPGKNCTWQGGGASYGCEKLNCWSMSGTNANACVNNSLSLNCEWSDYCYNTGYAPNTNCWENQNQSACLNATGCAWGQCMEKGCWRYDNTSSAICSAAKDYKGRNCTWDSTWNFCTENGCWRYGTNSSAAISERQTECQNTTATNGLSCEWKYSSCQDVDCYTWDFTNATACVNNSANLSCSWGGSYCMKQDCWSYSTQTTCQNHTECLWKSYASSGFCQEVTCWTWDSYNSGNQTQCENNSYGLSCLWGFDPSNSSGGWCYKDISSVSCSNFTTEKNCMDTFYCWWQYSDWSNVSAGGSCNEPGSWGGTATNTTMFNEWNPGCYIFDMNSSDCNNVIGCNYTNGQCDVLNNTYGGNITLNGLNCSYINSSTLCTNIPALSYCCSWQNGTCVANKLSSACRDQMQAPPDGAGFCEDYNSYENQALCLQIAGSPWYMPCQWDNSTGRCGFKASDVFGNESQSLVKIDNKKNCEAAGGKWISENYCEGNISVPTGRCEYKFDEEDNCDRACFACESKDSNGNTVNATNAQSSCAGSKLGICEFSADTNAPNGIGYCKAKEQFKKGIVGDCDSNCGDCTYKGDSNSNDTTKKPSYYCTLSKANSDGGGCKWINDNSTLTGGYCVKKGEKTCEDACDRCKAISDCQNIGRTAVANQSGSCKWQGETSTGTCVNNVAGDVEICWNGEDDNSNGLIDCADSGCYADSYCGFVSGDCFGWTTQSSCNEHNSSCEWITDKWGSWCDFKGSQCWKYDFSESNCSAQSNCQWQNGTGGSWCEKDWSVGEVCMGLSRNACMLVNASRCNWTIDSWCSGTGNGTDWCNDNGGWCDHVDFAPKNCWMYTSGSTECDSHSGCTWRTDSYSMPHCEVNWSANCWQYTSNGTCSGNADCVWDIPPVGTGWCMSKADKCSSYTQQNCASASGGRCYWESWSSSCQAICYNSSYNAQVDNCMSASSLGCIWKQQGGWCEESSACTNSTSSNNQENCQATSGCRWKSSGWCDPKNAGFSAGAMAGGGGVGGSMGGDCFKYDGNQTLCTNKSIINISCGWFPEPSARCEVDWSKNCWMYASIEAGCNASNGCWFKNDALGSFCTNIMDQCWMNQTLQTDSAKCNENPYCINTSWGGCEPICSSQNATSCNVSLGCKYITGWCNPSGTTQMFDGMQAGAPAPLGIDDCNEGIQASVDICGFGMKDMGDAYGFGTGVNNFENASVCNKEKLSSFVMGMAGGGGGAGAGAGAGGGCGPSGCTSFGTERTGDGNDTIIYLVYLDTDGSTTGGCSLSHNSSSVGYEFRFKYSSQWNINTSKAVETFNAYKCEESDWKSTDIKLSAWKKLMCSDIGGPMIAVEKADLARFPTLYDSIRDMRVSIALIGNTGNISYPTDSAGPGWTTPGSTDFDIVSAFSYGADTSKFEDILKKGFIKGEDCFTSNTDNDGDGLYGCDDWDCQYAAICAGAGINAVGYADTGTPLVTGVKIEEYPDAALIMYDTNKPTNGTFELYGYGDTQCLNKTNLIYDIGILSENVRDYKTWHTALIYDANNTDISLNWPLVAGSTYNYKLKVCDSANKCAISKCTSFKTPSSLQKCGYCNFVTRIKAPTGWKVSYDVNRDGTYEHVQGEVCGPNAGMKTNYTDGRKVNVKLAKSDGSVYMEFLNASLTKTGLNDKVRTISNSTDLIYNTTSGTVGMIAETRDKIVNNLHPEGCRIKIPFTGTCDKLYHCNDNGENCTDKTAAAGGAPIDAVNCIWNVPYCEFSTYREALLTTTTTTTSGGGGGGGGGGGTVAEQLKYTGFINPGVSKEVVFTLEGLKVTSIQITAASQIANAGIKVKESSSSEAGSAVSEGEAAYKYLLITTSMIDAAQIASARVYLKVEKSWYSNNGYDVKTTIVKRNSTGSWEDLQTTNYKQDDTYYYFYADTPGLSYFAITAKRLVAEEKEAEEVVEEKKEEIKEEIPEEIPAEKPSNLGIWIGIGVVIVLFAIAGILLSKRKRK